MYAPMALTPAGDILANINEMQWLDVGGGTYFKVLRLCEKTGQWVLYVRMEPGARFQPHRHEGWGQFFITKGELIYDVGSAQTGTYGFEPIFAVHHEAGCEVETEMLFMGESAVTYFTPDGDIDYVMNVQALNSVAEGRKQLDVSPA